MSTDGSNPFLSCDDLIDAYSLKILFQQNDKPIKILDFQSLHERETYGHVQGSILVPEDLQLEDIGNEPMSPARNVLSNDGITPCIYDSQLVVVVTDQSKLEVTKLTLASLGYMAPNALVKWYIAGVNNFVKAGGLVEYPKIINFHSLQAAVDEHSVLLIDVRNHSELSSNGKIPKSFCVPLQEILDGAFQLPALNFKDKYGFNLPLHTDTFILTCNSGRRVLLAEVHLKSLGYVNIRTYLGSFQDWVSNGGKIIEGL